MNSRALPFTRRPLVRRVLPTLVLLVGLGGSSVLIAGVPGVANAGALYISASGNPTFSIGSTTAVPGGVISIGGSGFLSGETVYLTISGQSGAFTAVQADGAGNLATNVTLPASLAPGTYQITAYGAISTHSAATWITINAGAPALSVNVSSVNAGGSVLVSGSGFMPNEAVSIALSGQSGVLAVIQSDGSGTLPATSVTLPAAEVPGAYTLTASGAGSDVASTALSVNSLFVTVNAITVTSGGSIVLSGGGFAPNELVNVTINTLPGVLATLRADASGNLSATTLPIPWLAAGSYTLMLTGLTSGNVADAPLIVNSPTVTAVSASPTIAVNTAASTVGGAFTVSGSGFAPNELVSITLVGIISSGSTAQSGVLATIQTDASGNLPATSVAIPASVAPGFYAVTATGLSSGASANIALIVNS